MTSIHKAFEYAFNGDADSLDALLSSKKIGPNSVNDAGLSLLSIACKRGNNRIVEILLNYGADPNRRNTQIDPFSDRVLRKESIPLSDVGNIECAKLLIESGSEINVVDGLGKTPLAYAALRRDVPVVRFLCEHGADPDAELGDGVTVFELLNQRIERFKEAFGEKPTSKQVAMLDEFRRIKDVLSKFSRIA